MKRLKLVGFLSILVSFFLLAYAKSDKKGLRRFLISFRTALIMGVILTSLSSKSPEATDQNSQVVDERFVSNQEFNWLEKNYQQVIQVINKGNPFTPPTPGTTPTPGSMGSGSKAFVNPNPNRPPGPNLNRGRASSPKIPIPPRLVKSDGRNIWGMNRGGNPGGNPGGGDGGFNFDDYAPRRRRPKQDQSTKPVDSYSNTKKKKDQAESENEEFESENEESESENEEFESENEESESENEESESENEQCEWSDWKNQLSAWEKYQAAQAADQCLPGDEKNLNVDRLEVVDLIKESSGLMREAMATAKDPRVTKDIKNLINRLSLGFINPGSGTKSLKGFDTNIREARTVKGARLYFRFKERKIEVLGVSSKKNQKDVIKGIRKLLEELDERENAKQCGK